MICYNEKIKVNSEVCHPTFLIFLIKLGKQFKIQELNQVYVLSIRTIQLALL